MVLPFVSIAKEKLKYLQVLWVDISLNICLLPILYYLKWLLEDNSIKAAGFIGSMSPNGGFNTIDIAICTIEKANSLINRLIEDDLFFELGILKAVKISNFSLNINFS